MSIRRHLLALLAVVSIIVGFTVGSTSIASAGIGASVPSAPTGLDVYIQKGSAWVYFTVGANGGSPITNYEYQLNGTGEWIAISPARPYQPVIVTGLTNGTSYTVKVRAVNAVGAGSASASSASFTPLARLLTPAQEGTVSILAGTGDYDTPTPGPAASSALAGVNGLVVDASGNAYIADWDNNRVLKITSDGTLSFFAGTGTWFNWFDVPPAITPGPATSTDLPSPSALAVDAAGNVYVSASSARQVVKITPDGTLSIVAGTGAWFDPYGPGPVLTPGPATGVDLSTPQGLAVDPAGNLYILDTGYGRVLKVATDGDLSVVAGTGEYGAPTPGPATSSTLECPGGIAVDPSGNLYIADPCSRMVLKVTTDGTLSIFAGMGVEGLPTPGPATSSALDRPESIAVDSAGNVFVIDWESRAVVRITPTGTLTVVAGTGYRGQPTAGPVADSDLSYPYRVAVDTAGDLYITDYDYKLLEKVTFDRSTVAPDAPSAPTSLGATPGDGSASISFTAGSDGGASISKYQYQLGSGSWTDAVGTTSPITISGLTNGTAYSIKLRAVNTAGDGAASDAVSVTPRTVPGAPSITSVTPGDSTVSVAFTAGSTGGSVITDYEYQLNGSGSWFSLGTTSSPASIGVTNGVAYTVKLRAVNVAGNGAASSASGSFTPRTTPLAPTGLVATAGVGSASISFTAGADGGAAISKYQYKVGNGSWIDAVGTTSPIIISGLTNYATAKIRLRAVNSAGAGVASSPVSVTPRQAGPAAIAATPSGRTGIIVTFNLNPLPGTTVAYQSVVAYERGTNTVRGSCRTYGKQATCYIGGLTRATNYDLRVTAYLPVPGKSWHNTTAAGSILQVRTNN